MVLKNIYTMNETGITIFKSISLLRPSVSAEGVLFLRP